MEQTVKRYLLFHDQETCFLGGFHNFKGTFDTIELAQKEYFKEVKKKYDEYNKQYYDCLKDFMIDTLQTEWIQIVDHQTLQVVWESDGHTQHSEEMINLFVMLAESE